jgi:nitroimidazol reductase NimA-like FMN-containing flavoprotein (pyridoxamine 5'-phosphate oxidase superfamily)
LTETECHELLVAMRVGRVAYCDEHGPVVVPVNYVADGDGVLLRVAPHTDLAVHLRSAPASFQVDDVDDYTQSGWSVLLRGQARWVDAADFPAVERLQPWPEGERTQHVRIDAHEITGRRLLEA